MGFFDHIDELRARLFRAVVVFFIGFILCYAYVDQWVLAFLRKPLFDVMPPEQQKLYFTSLFENFMTHLKIAGYSSIFFVSPYFFYEIWAFVAPGLYPRERKWLVPFILAATCFFVGGALFAYYVMFPVAFKFFVTYGEATDVAMLTIANYYDTCLKLLLLFGLAFELPVLIVLLGFLGVVDADMLRAQRKVAVIAITVGCAMFAPPDAISMLILMTPLILMYEGSIWVVQMIGKRKPPPEATTTEEGPPVNPLSGQSR
ncbi:MAG: twin-arginine translocase subunit TatC [Bacteriovoracia bacterium]